MKSNSPNLQGLPSLRLEQNTKSILNALSHILCQNYSTIETNLNVKYEMQCKYDWHDMLLKNLGTTPMPVEIVTNSEREEPMPQLEDASDAEVEYPVEGEALVTRRILSAQIKEDDDQQQRENIFHTRCHINNKVCSLIIVGGW